MNTISSSNYPSNIELYTKYYPDMANGIHIPTNQSKQNKLGRFSHPQHQLNQYKKRQQRLKKKSVKNNSVKRQKKKTLGIVQLKKGEIYLDNGGGFS